MHLSMGYAYIAMALKVVHSLKVEMSGPVSIIVKLSHAKLIPCSTNHQGNEIGSVGRKENKIKHDVISCFLSCSCYVSSFSDIKIHCPCSNNSFVSVA